MSTGGGAIILGGQGSSLLGCLVTVYLLLVAFSPCSSEVRAMRLDLKSLPLSVRLQDSLLLMLCFICIALVPVSSSRVLYPLCSARKTVTSLPQRAWASVTV